MRKRKDAERRDGLRGDRVRELRKALKLSQYKLVEEMAQHGATVDQTYISIIENGNVSLNNDALASLSKALQTNPGYLLGMTDDPRPHEELEREISVSVENSEERRALERLFRALEALPPEKRATYYSALEVMYQGLLRQAESEAKVTDG